ncbi:hypothetical protein CDD83_7257 [Cordyceps sp. RAO-2017]|nr:hypothetical protein CDD83_7257 [Cordyceps sp. RAO-2017]
MHTARLAPCASVRSLSCSSDSCPWPYRQQRTVFPPRLSADAREASATTSHVPVVGLRAQRALPRRAWTDISPEKSTGGLARSEDGWSPAWLLLPCIVITVDPLLLPSSPGPLKVRRGAAAAHQSV